MKVNFASLFTFLNSLPLVRNLSVGVKRFLGTVLTVAVALAGVLAVVVATGPTLHIGMTDQTYLVAAASVLSAVITELKLVTQTAAAKQNAATQAAALTAARAELAAQNVPLAPAPLPVAPLHPLP